MCMTEDAFKELLPGIKNFDFTWGINIDPKEQSSVDEIFEIRFQKTKILQSKALAKE